ncbi:DUF2480 family protein [Psychroflexus montanilacus]|uniref:DUF2480 family protein n=1 Tax=Psychroflexus montanilacus TaxID=2873598 RepID=UPI001CCA7812|nr:DUF2480 family protein [Psychroflexus montanilacus]MBZ9651601.1 DUF2480 family protein [Psychroflexus montanilacus]
MAEIVNKVAQSSLKTFNLEEYYPDGNRQMIDIKDWLFEGIILKEKDFRETLKHHDWSQYKDTYVALHCSSEAIVPGWAYLLITSYLQGISRKVVYGDYELLNSILFEEVLSDLDVSEYQDKPVIIKGCSHKPVPENAYLMALQKLQPVAKSIMYGEACSAVPLYKRPKK